jgi:hypothetical protein
MKDKKQPSLGKMGKLDLPHPASSLEDETDPEQFLCVEIARLQKGETCRQLW